MHAAKWKIGAATVGGVLTVFVIATLILLLWILSIQVKRLKVGHVSLICQYIAFNEHAALLKTSCYVFFQLRIMLEAM